MDFQVGLATEDLVEADRQGIARVLQDLVADASRLARTRGCVLAHVGQKRLEVLRQNLDRAQDRVHVSSGPRPFGTRRAPQTTAPAPPSESGNQPRLPAARS